MIREWKQRNANPPIKQLHDALTKSGRADLAKVLYEEAERHNLPGLKPLPVIFSTRLQQIQDWIKLSLKRRLNKSLSHDWIPERSAHKFPLRKYYVQLEWKQKTRTAMGSETRTLTSLHDLVRQMTSETCNTSQGAAAKQHSDDAPSVIVEGTCTNIRFEY